ncbi:MAG TPA: ATP-binding protein [Vicinamibacterales bacterium]|nr:ATP-binding protein [Vicinamibacterales bacterium]
MSKAMLFPFVLASLALPCRGRPGTDHRRRVGPRQVVRSSCALYEAAIVVYDAGTFAMAVVHLISGLPGAGKSTYAQQLQLRTRAVVFTLDRFLITMFGRYEVPDVGGEEHVRRVLACREVIWMSAEKLLAHGSDVILDDGYFLRGHRRKVVDAATALGASAKIHFIDTPLDEIRRRLADRNRSLPVYNFAIEAETLEGCVRLFETPSDADAAEVVVVQNTRSSI